MSSIRDEYSAEEKKKTKEAKKVAKDMNKPTRQKHEELLRLKDQAALIKKGCKTKIIS